MGYDFHISRRNDWADEGGDITAEEWLDYVRSDRELTLAGAIGPYYAVWCGASEHSEAWLDWSRDRIYTKDPDSPLIDKMIAIARRLGATVQGDDGEVYDEMTEGQDACRTPHQPTPTFKQRVAGWFARLRPSRAIPVGHEPLPFRVGDQVRDPWGHQHTVTEIDPTAEHGMGIIRTRRADGSELGHMMVAHGLVPVEQRKQQK